MVTVLSIQCPAKSHCNVIACQWNVCQYLRLSFYCLPVLCLSAERAAKRFCINVDGGEGAPVFAATIGSFYNGHLFCGHWARSKNVLDEKWSFLGNYKKARSVQQRRIQKKNTALECTAVSLLVAPAAPLPGWGSLSLLQVHSPPIFVLLLQQPWRQFYSMLNVNIIVGSLIPVHSPIFSCCKVLMVAPMVAPILLPSLSKSSKWSFHTSIPSLHPSLQHSAKSCTNAIAFTI